MAINFALAPRWQVDPAEDPMGRSWIGWDRTASDEQLWENNRGVWRLSPTRMQQERLATLSYEGVIQVVAEIDGYEDVPTQTEMKKALLGRVLVPGDPLREAVVGTPAPAQRNPVGYVDTTEEESITPEERGRETGGRPPSTFLVNSNPHRWVWDPVEYQQDVQHTQAGRIVRGRWSVGHRRSGIEPGDRVYLLRQGTGSRGLIGSGRVASRIFQGTHWDPEQPGAEANYVLIDWEVLMDEDDPLPIEALQAELPTQYWTPQASGTAVRDEVVEALLRLWESHVGRPVPPRGTPAQGWQMDAERRKKVENAAQDRLMHHYRDQGWTVLDTRHGHPYDAVAQRGNQMLYLEAKGTESQGRSVIVTRGEVRHARNHPDQCVMGVLSGVLFDDAGEVVQNSGTFTSFVWNPTEDELTARDYDYRPQFADHSANSPTEDLT